MLIEQFKVCGILTTYHNNLVSKLILLLGMNFESDWAQQNSVYTTTPDLSVYDYYTPIGL